MFEFDGGRCNSLGLTSIGLQLARTATDHGAVLDIDHLSLKAKTELRHSDAGIGEHYPLVSSHSGFADLNHGDKSNEDQLTAELLRDLIKWDGAFAPILHQADTTSQLETWPEGATTAPHACGGTTESYIQAYRYLVDQLRSTTRFDGTPAYVGVGYGSDFNGLAGWPAGRFDTATEAVGEVQSLDTLFVGGKRTPSPGRCYLAIGGFPATPPHLTYPFTPPGSTEEFHKTVLDWSGRTTAYEISSDGIAHVGMIPDFVEEMRTLGLSDADMQPLWRGAEAYLRTWHASLKWGDSISWEAETVKETCREHRKDLSGHTVLPHNQPQYWAYQKRDALRDAGCYGLP